MIDLRGLQWADILALSVLIFSLVGAFVLWWRERATGGGGGRRERRRKGDLLERANAELEGRRLLREGWQAFQAGEERRAEHLLKSALLRLEELGDSPLAGQARYRLALLYQTKGEIDQAVRTLKPVMELRSPHPQHYLLLARLYERLGRFDRAQWALRAARRRFKDLHGVSEWLRRLEEEDYRQSAVSPNGARHLTSALGRLPGVGRKTASSLVQYGFEVLPLVAYAQPEDLAVIPHLSEAKATQIIAAARQELAGRGARAE